MTCLKVNNVNFWLQHKQAKCLLEKVLWSDNTKILLFVQKVETQVSNQRPLSLVVVRS